ncbi:hypothetical protein OX283_006635 [Flavobacterium sp. SUN052]|uniref:hypothetical protein n=1 Tax=Flavobacterium sp. SUN052 TaxID=3002441 RepID=UPI00237E61EE|nr:hypothetical protein [Flavobacterium sp. SUN052]MEC4004325.1 hypothetical protein [Flavobacterium sp. SUN052]
MKYFIETIKDKNDILFIYGIICLLGAIICFILSKYNSIQILGISGWIKPFKFFLSTAIFTFTIAFYLQFLDNQNQVTIYNWSLILFLSIELILITYQASQGKTSHFNIATSLDKAIFNIMGIAISILMLHTLYMGILFFNQTQFNAPETLILAIKLSIIVMVIFAFEGLVMGGLLKHTVGSQDGSSGLPILNWSKNYGDLRVAHFFGMHALQIIPLVTYFLAKSKRDVIIISSVYLLFVTYTLIQAFQSKPFIKF